MSSYATLISTICLQGSEYLWIRVAAVCKQNSLTTSPTLTYADIPIMSKLKSKNSAWMILLTCMSHLTTVSNSRINGTVKMRYSRLGKKAAST